MKRIGIVALALGATLAMSAMATGTASATKLTLSEGGAALLPAKTFEAFGQDRNLFVTTSLGPLECRRLIGENGLEASVVSNSKATDELQITRLFEGEEEESCESYTGNARFYLESLTGPLKLRANGRATSGPVELYIEYEHVTVGEETYGAVECYFSSGRLTGTNTATATKQRLEIELEGKLALDRHKGFDAKRLCPKTAEMSISLPFTENEEGEREVIEEQT
jgi:hypothetical protein